MVPEGTVVLAATPIGNTGDASDRLKALLEHADIVAAEDTRRLYDLANRLGVHVNGRVVAYHDHNERDKADGLLDNVETGATVLVVSDAGMPTINDPGLAIVRRAIERNLPVTCAPGPSAVLDALCLSGLPTDRFCYEGFLPRKHAERMQHLRMLKSEPRTIVFYETLHRIADSMDDLLESFGPNRHMALCRELTKDYEQIRRGTIAEIHDSVVNDPPRGEMVLVIEGAGDHCCEYMTGGVVLVLGKVGLNFGAGFTGGLAYVLDQDRDFVDRYNHELIDIHRISPEGFESYRQHLHRLVGRHRELTGSIWAQQILDEFRDYVGKFWLVKPKAASIESLADTLRRAA